MPRFKTSDVADEKTEQCTFAELSLSTSLLRSLQEMGCEHPSPVQLHSIPLALGGGDVIIQAKSGTGKTIAFCSVVLEGIDTSTAGSSQAVILAPTREIAMQISDELSRLGWYLDPPVDVGCFIGGVPIEEHEERLSNCSPHVAVGSPGRTLKLLRDGILLTDARFLVLDEADKLLDSYFRQDIFAITEMVFTKQLQFLAVSATFPPPLVAIAEDLFVHVEKKHATRGQPIERELPHKVFLCTSAVKKDEDGLNIDELDQDGEKAETALLKGVLHVRYVLEGYHVRQKLPALLEVLTTASYQQAFVFVADSNNAIQIAEMLNQAGVPAAASGGKMEQSWRTQAFAGLKRFQYRVLVCTDLMARGIDAENVDVVVNLNLPVEKETYLHRSGRTARFGSVGWMVSLVFAGEEAEHLDFFQKQLGFELVDFADREAAMAAKLQQLDIPDTEVGLTQKEIQQLPQQPFPTPPAPTQGGFEKRKRTSPNASAIPKRRLAERKEPKEPSRQDIPPAFPPTSAHTAFPAFSQTQEAFSLPQARNHYGQLGHLGGNLAPPPILLPPGGLPLNVALPEWESWMLDSDFAAYVQKHCPASQQLLLGLTSGTKERLDALWHHHRRVWTGA
ncbi:unnamed protein product [Durusdinium trenchii]|uniref:Uncharacterized protein n=2 Tax=Durusdinium trenchii TaxID=1381693 RepID=A0ABP0ISA5_9DINO